MVHAVMKGGPPCKSHFPRFPQSAQLSSGQRAEYHPERAQQTRHGRSRRRNRRQVRPWVLGDGKVETDMTTGLTAVLC